MVRKKRDDPFEGGRVSGARHKRKVMYMSGDAMTELRRRSAGGCQYGGGGGGKKGDL